MKNLNNPTATSENVQFASSQSKPKAEQSPTRFLLLLWGLPFLVILAAVALRMLKGD
jgi:hypothetical protein